MSASEVKTSYVDSTRAGVLKGEAVNIYSAAFDDRFQAWLAKALDFDPKRVVPNYKDAETPFIDGSEDRAFFEFSQVSYIGDPWIKEETEDYTTFGFAGEAKCRITIVGSKCREKAFFLHDLMFLAQSVAPLKALGLSLSGADVIQFANEREGSRLTLYAVIDLSFSYVYERKWSIKSLLSAETTLNSN